MKCWICGNEGNSAEHFVKASDIKLYFPKFDQKKPVYVHRRRKYNLPIGSPKSDHIKSNALLCKKCNNERTQKHDYAWETLSNYIENKWEVINRSNRIELKEAFPGNSTKSAINIHLFFLKLFGCALNEQPNENSNDNFIHLPEMYNTQEMIAYIDTLKNNLSKEFALCILAGKPHNDVFLSFAKSPPEMDNCGITDLHTRTDTKSNRIALAFWGYFQQMCHGQNSICSSVKL